MKPRVGVCHPGTQHSWQTALAFQENSTLAWYSTSIFYDPSRWPYKIEKYLPSHLCQGVHREFTRRYWPALSPNNIRQFGVWEWIERAASRLGAQRLEHWANSRGNISFNRLVIKLLEREPVDVLIGYDTSSLEVFRWAKQRGIRCVLEQTIGHPESLNQAMITERARCPEYFSNSAPISSDVISRVNQELELADLVIVGSEVCARTLIQNKCPETKIAIVPYGFDETSFPELSQIADP